jgi:uncharacterized protein YndB with AHSA1/START domain
MSGTVERSIDLDVSAEELWELVTEPSELEGWLGEEVDIDVRPGGLGRVVDHGVERRVVVEQVDDGRRFSYVWWPEGSPGEVSRVELVVLPAATGSRLVVTETTHGLDAFACAGGWSRRSIFLRARLVLAGAR